MPDLKVANSWNKRIERQKGTFFAFANKTNEKEKKTVSTTEARDYIILSELVDAPSVISSHEYTARISVPHDEKKAIMRVLKECGICEDYLLP